MSDNVINARSAMFHSRFAELQGVSAFLEVFCAEQAAGRELCLRLNLVLEELFVNTVQHGHGGGSDEPVWVTLDATPEAVHVTYEDTGQPFNPYAHLPAKPPDTALEMRKTGGLGVLLTKELAATRDYAYLFGRNRIRLALKR